MFEDSEMVARVGWGPVEGQSIGSDGRPTDGCVGAGGKSVD